MRLLRLLTIVFFLFFMNCTNVSTQEIEPGVSLELAKQRKGEIKNIKYNLHFSIPENIDEKVEGKVLVEFDFINEKKDIVLDFQARAEQVLAIRSNGQKCSCGFSNEHIIIQRKDLKEGKNSIEIDFIAGNSALNRRNDFLYTLFVPDKASIAFPCFDQPDLKAKYNLQLTIPGSWIAASNGKVVSEQLENGRKKYRFSETKIISTYHFAFAAGKFQKLSKTQNGKTINFYHKESDLSKLERNKDTILSMHFMAIDWMEKYTGIDYPFQKLDFVVIPSFQFVGMEHVGAIFYRDSKMLLSESATSEQIMKRASTICHEVSHMWFGDLVTMEWFDDVWLKEVYAELMAAKMIGPMFPDIDLDLNFVCTSYPRAYQTDRTKGTHPVKQELCNMKFAGTLYGDIIYYKAPIIMAKLERIVGEEALQDGLKEYLNKYKYGNAEWADLITILNQFTAIDLNEWSNNWVTQEGMPIISSEIDYGADEKIKQFKIKQRDAFGQGRIWKQSFEVLHYKNGEYKKTPIYLDSKEAILPGLVGFEKPDFFLLNGGGYGYGYFVLDTSSKQYLIDHINELDDNMVRTVAYITLFQELVNFNIEPRKYVLTTINALKEEQIKQNTQMLLNDFERCWWYFLNNEERKQLTGQVEADLLDMIKNNKNSEIQSSVFETLLAVFISKETQDQLYTIWESKGKLYDLQPSKRDYSTIALELSLRNYPNAEKILQKQLASIKNEQRRKEMEFIMPSVSVKEEVRDSFFESLQQPKNREREIWVRSALYYLNHPLRAKYSIKYLEKSLEMLEEIQQTGDIFFPKNWLAYSIGRHSSAEAAHIVNKFLEDNPDYNKNLRAKILQLSDYLFRAEKMQEKMDYYGNGAPVPSNE